MFLSKIINYLGKAIKSNTGVSSLSLIVVLSGVMAVLILLVIGICMLIEVITTHTIASSLDGYAAIIAAVSALITAVGIPKAINNYGENKYKNSKDTIIEDEDKV